MMIFDLKSSRFCTENEYVCSKWGLGNVNTTGAPTAQGCLPRDKTQTFCKTDFRIPPDFESIW